VAQVSTFDRPMRIDPEAYSFDPGQEYIMEDHVVLGKRGEWSYCDYITPEDPVHNVNLLSAVVPEGQ